MNEQNTGLNSPVEKQDRTFTVESSGQNRGKRELESREASTRPSDAWVPPSQLPAPNPVDGWAFRYIRTASLGKDDTRNVSRRFREGWVPVSAKDHPELSITSDRGSEWPDGVEIGGLLLCKIPAEIARQRNEHYANVAQQQLDSVDSGFMNDQHPHMPKHNESTSRTDFRKG